MTLHDKQLEICSTLDADELLRQGGCKAIAEDSLAIGADLKKQLLIIKGVAIVVMTPSVNRIGGSVPGFMPVQVPSLTVSCVEMPALNRSRAGAMTALQAAERVATLLDSAKCNAISITQSTDESTGSLSAAVVFSTTMMLSLPTTQQ